MNFKPKGDKGGILPDSALRLRDLVAANVVSALVIRWEFPKGLERFKRQSTGALGQSKIMTKHLTQAPHRFFFTLKHSTLQLQSPLSNLCLS